jgi:hypothetical protein
MRQAARAATTPACCRVIRATSPRVGHTLRRMEGTRHSVTSADGIRIGLLTCGSGPALLLVHGGMGTPTSLRSRPRWPANRAAQWT